MKATLLPTLAALLTLAAIVRPTPAAVVIYAGSQTDLGPGWRTSGTSKPLDLDEDNVLGTDGYHVVNLPPVRPSYLNTTEILTSTYPGNSLYSSIDDPVNTANLFLTGTMNPHPGPGASADLFRFTVNASAQGRTIRVGLLVDNLDDANWNATSLSLMQTNGFGVTTGPVATSAASFNNRIPDWVFFDITGGFAGDTFVVQGTGGLLGVAALAGVVFDSRTNFIVTTTNDSGPGSLRGIATVAPAGTTITFAANLSGATITLTNGEISLNQTVTLDASGLPAGIIVSGDNATGIFSVGASASVSLVSLTLANGNRYDGGALYNAAGSTLSLSRCTLTGNSAVEGGAILNDGALVLSECTLAGNFASYGGAIQCRATTTISQCTLSGNTGYYGGGGLFINNAPVGVNNSIIAGNAAPGTTDGGSDVFIVNGALVYSYANLVPLVDGYQVTTPTTGPAPLTNAPQLAPLGNYGGPTPTMPPLPGSPAIDACTGGTGFATDQRGLPRKVGPGPDLGAVEFQGAGPVTTAADSGVGSLRYALTYATNGQVITFAGSLSGSTILLTGGQFLLNQNLTIDASGLPGGLQINGSGASRIFYVESNATVVLNFLTLANGLAHGANGTNASTDRFSNPAAGGPGTAGLGGCIYNTGGLTLNQVTLIGNSAIGGDGGVGNRYQPGASAPGQGGGIYNAGTLTLSRCTLAGNSASGGTGGYGNFFDGSAGSLGQGGGIFNTGTLTLNQVTLSGDSANGGGGGSTTGTWDGRNRYYTPTAGSLGQGGGIYNAGALALNQVTLSGEFANGGAGGWSNGVPSVSGSSEGGGIYSISAFTVFNTIVAGNAALSGSDLVGSFAASGNNLTDGDPLLAPLGNYGGPTPTMPPLPGSPAIDAGSDDATNAPYSFATDQRGFPRWSGPHVDLGAVELVVGAPSITALTAVVIGTDAANGAALVQLSASVNPNNELSSMVYFQYGLTSTYAGTNGPISSPPMYSLFHATNLSVTVGLAPGFTYHWRAVAASSTYTTSTPDQTFHLTAPGIPGDSNGDGIVSQSEFAAVLANLHGNGIVSQSDLDLVLSNYWPHSPWLFMTNVAGLGAANVTFALGNSLAGAYSAEYTTNLTDWLPLGPATPRYQFTDTNAPALPQRFYRLRWP